MNYISALILKKSSIGGSLGEDGREGVYPIELIIGDHHEEGEDGFLDCKKVIVSWFPFKGGGGVMGLVEVVSDSIGCHHES